MKSISLKLLVLILLIALAIISIWLERKADEGSSNGVKGDQSAFVNHQEDLLKLERNIIGMRHKARAVYPSQNRCI
ncbi:hypothetical protein [Paenibacillus paeoniae]|uniref:Uncharacterized protein n=1 Tax=Paenibacillus paeoniae TaxID=2292705 RepID=A0A371NZQ0_9BACL|nr:hypothetical protein [Paenibacillus paeoniae]REK69153.1 hypothetical protein DX130_25840 [Paenibacillus paeoniae]